METEFYQLLLNNGFAVFVAVYVLMRLERTLKQNTQILTELKVIIKGRCKYAKGIYWKKEEEECN